jgi:hypothetical protein
MIAKMGVFIASTSVHSWTPNVRQAPTWATKAMQIDFVFTRQDEPHMIARIGIIVLIKKWRFSYLKVRFRQSPSLTKKVMPVCICSLDKMSNPHDCKKWVYS